MSGPVPFITAAVAAALAVGLLVITATVLGVDTLRGQSSSGDHDLAFYLLTGGTLAGILLAAATAWRLLAPIPSSYRRAGLALVSGFATTLTMLVCIPVNQLLGRAGLLLLLGLSGLTAVLLTRRARRLGAEA